MSLAFLANLITNGTDTRVIRQETIGARISCSIKMLKIISANMQGVPREEKENN
jgi:hypothetical protein